MNGIGRRKSSHGVRLERLLPAKQSRGTRYATAKVIKGLTREERLIGRDVVEVYVDRLGHACSSQHHLCSSIDSARGESAWQAVLGVVGAQYE